MKTLVLVILFLGYCLSFAQPRIEIENHDICDWGNIDPKGEPLTAKVKIYNKGTDTLNIIKIKPTCGCTTAPLDKNSIEPNGYATLDIKLNVSNEGPVHKSIKVTSNDPDNPNKSISLKANVIKAVSVNPGRIIIKDMEIDHESSFNVVIANNSDKAFDIKDLKITPDDLKVNLKKGTKIKPNESYKAEIKYTPKESSNLSGIIVLTTDNKDYESISISVFGRMKTNK